ncbi:hypothetical protein B0T13DRAFT_248062 [Neurospora crassa]|nr:hypothetical protein B0T13DRAFT_248062 [Neurospora crassa]
MPLSLSMEEKVGGTWSYGLWRTQNSQRLQSCIDRRMAVVHDTRRLCPPCESKLCLWLITNGGAHTSGRLHQIHYFVLYSPCPGQSISISVHTPTHRTGLRGVRRGTIDIRRCCQCRGPR